MTWEPHKPLGWVAVLLFSIAFVLWIVIAALVTIAVAMQG